MRDAFLTASSVAFSFLHDQKITNFFPLRLLASGDMDILSQTPVFRISGFPYGKVSGKPGMNRGSLQAPGPAVGKEG